jgi:hypothetical protein
VSCLDPAAAICSKSVPVRLETNRGGFYLYEPCTNNASASGNNHILDNFGIFWAEKGDKSDDRRHDPHDEAR